MIRLLAYNKFTFFIILFIYTVTFQAQNKFVTGVDYIEELIENDSLQKAEKELIKRITLLKTQKKADSLIKYIHLIIKDDIIWHVSNLLYLVWKISYKTIHKNNFPNHFFHKFYIYW